MIAIALPGVLLCVRFFTALLFTLMRAVNCVQVIEWDELAMVGQCGKDGVFLVIVPFIRVFYISVAVIRVCAV